ncbi:hypothetical protein BDZ91DRAFT_844448 [Kalaharituber pfeilii]|nr:hypothetical protein BDZ91DRAFT_844448 [Kalaharituber pfeilii]
MSFHFNFSNSSDVSIHDDSTSENAPQPRDQSPHIQNPPVFHTLEDLISTLPQNISYNTLSLAQSWNGNPIRICRRELYDVRMQLMAEDEALGIEDNISTKERSKKEKDALLEFVSGNEDVRAGKYEGGLKSWECSIDLVKWLAQREEGPFSLTSNERLSVLELGCGTSLPTLFLYQIALSIKTNAVSRAFRKFDFHLADYNYSVLRLVTLPNLFLSWILHSHPHLLSFPTGDLDVTESLKGSFLSSLRDMAIDLGFVSGCWGLDMLKLLGCERVGKYDLVLGSETIYEPATMPEFTRVLLGSMSPQGRGIVAAKRIYFGVGGSVSDFVKQVKEYKRGDEIARWEVRTANEADKDSGGVGRVILDVLPRSAEALEVHMGDM